MTTSVDTEKLTIEEFVRLYDQEGPFEIVDGERIKLSPTVLGHNSVADNFHWALSSHIRPRALGKIYVEAPFVLLYDSGWVRGSRVPDVMFITAERMNAYIASDPDWESKPLVMVPDFAVEIVSPGDSYIEIENKVSGYLRDGVRLVWVINPQARTVTVHVPGSNQQTVFHAEDTITGGEVIPGFEISVAALFA